MKKPVVNYLELRPSNLNSPRFRHLWLLLFWPIYGLLFMFVERFYQVDSYYVMYCALDDLIPFQELFLIPYLFWFVFLVGMIAYTLFYDIPAFKKMMYFIMMTYGFSIAMYLLFPTCQNLRPESFERDNFLTRFMAGFYEFDTNTNVCPSIHVIGSLAVMFGAWHCEDLQHWAWKWGFGIVAALISISTVLLKQHSVLDVFAALAVCAVAYPICFLDLKNLRSSKAQSAVTE